MKFAAYLPFMVAMVPTVLITVAVVVSIAEPATPPAAKGRVTSLSHTDASELQASNASILSLSTSSAVPVAGKLCTLDPSTKRSVG